MLEVTDLLTLFLGLLAAALVAQPLARMLRLPYPSVLVIVGFIGSELIVAAGGDTGLRAGSFQQLVFFVFLPVLVFEAAYGIDLAELRAQLPRILMLAIGVMLGTTVLSAALLYHGIGHPGGFPWIAALLTGAILAATDPASVLAQMKQVGGPPEAKTLLEGESLFNDATAIVVFGILLGLALEPDAEVMSGAHVLRFAGVFLGGLACGVLAGAAGYLLLRLFPDAEASALVTLFLAYLTFFVAEHVLHVSGVIATLTAGLCLSVVSARQISSANRKAIHFFWKVAGSLTSALVFLLMGVTITVSMFEHRWLAMLIAIAAVLLARSACVFTAFALVRPFAVHPVSANFQWLLVWSGTRGAVTLALALSLPVELEYWWTIQSIAFGVVCFSLFVQAPTGALAMRQLGFIAR